MRNQLRAGGGWGGGAAGAGAGEEVEIRAAKKQNLRGTGGNCPGHPGTCAVHPLPLLSSPGKRKPPLLSLDSCGPSLPALPRLPCTSLERAGCQGLTQALVVSGAPSVTSSLLSGL